MSYGQQTFYAMNKHATISLKHVSKSYWSGGTEVEVLSDLEFGAAKNDVIAIKGVSGCGKTTLLNLIGCLDRPDAGEIFVNGIDLSSQSNRQLAEFRRNSLGFVFQRSNLLAGLTALENVLIPLRLTGVTGADALGKATAGLAQVSLTEKLQRRRPSELSAGEMQRVAIARAIINRPSILLADEPTGNLDGANKIAIMNLLLKLHESGETVIVIVTHDDAIAERCNTVYELRARGLEQCR